MVAGSRWGAFTPPALLAVLVLVTRWPFRTTYLFNWDAANFALGIHSFDVTQHQPHPPGYPYYVGLGALLNGITGDANTALVAESVLLEALAVVAIYLLGKALFSSWAGAAAALLLAGSVTFWSYGELALAYPALAAFSTLFALCAYKTILQRKDWLLPAAAVYAVGSGFRPDLALFLLPLLLVACKGQPPAKIALTLAIGFGGVLAWLAPVALLSGGFQEYVAVMAAYAGTDVLERYAPTARGLAGLMVNVRDTTQYLAYALYAEAAVVLGGVMLLARGRTPRTELPKYLFLLGWMAPMVAFYVFVHIGDPGYVFSFLPALLLLAVGGWREFLQPSSASSQGDALGTSRRKLALAGLAAVLLANGLIFFFHQRPLTLPGLRANDAAVGAKLDYIHTYRPGEVLLVSYDSFKHYRYYLPEYSNSVWLDTSTAKRQVFPIPAGVKWAVLTDPSVLKLMAESEAKAEYPPEGTPAAKLPVREGQSLVYEEGRLSVLP